MYTEQELNNPFWQFSVAIYAAPGVSSECLNLQNAFGVDVNLLLFCAWSGVGLNVLLTTYDIEEASATVQEWHLQIVRPLRNVRQELDFHGRNTSLRSKLKEAELESEQYEQAMLYEFAHDRWSAPSSGSSMEYTSQNVRAYLLLAGMAHPSDYDSRWPQQLVKAAIGMNL